MPSSWEDEYGDEPAEDSDYSGEGSEYTPWQEYAAGDSNRIGSASDYDNIPIRSNTGGSGEIVYPSSESKTSTTPAAEQQVDPKLRAIYQSKEKDKRVYLSRLSNERLRAYEEALPVLLKGEESTAEVQRRYVRQEYQRRGIYSNEQLKKVQETRKAQERAVLYTEFKKSTGRMPSNEEAVALREGKPVTVEEKGTSKVFQYLPGEQGLSITSGESTRGFYSRVISGEIGASPSDKNVELLADKLMAGSPVTLKGKVFTPVEGGKLQVGESPSAFISKEIAATSGKEPSREELVSLLAGGAVKIGQTTYTYDAGAGEISWSTSSPMRSTKNPAWVDWVASPKGAKLKGDKVSYTVNVPMSDGRVVEVEDTMSKKDFMLNYGQPWSKPVRTQEQLEAEMRESFIAQAQFRKKSYTEKVSAFKEAGDSNRPTELTKAQKDLLLTVPYTQRVDIIKASDETTLKDVFLLNAKPGYSPLPDVYGGDVPTTPEDRYAFERQEIGMLTGTAMIYTVEGGLMLGATAMSMRGASTVVEEPGVVRSPGQQPLRHFASGPTYTSFETGGVSYAETLARGGRFTTRGLGAVMESPRGGDLGGRAVRLKGLTEEDRVMMMEAAMIREGGGLTVFRKGGQTTLTGDSPSGIQIRRTKGVTSLDDKAYREELEILRLNPELIKAKEEGRLGSTVEERGGRWVGDGTSRPYPPYESPEGRSTRASRLYEAKAGESMTVILEKGETATTQRGETETTSKVVVKTPRQKQIWATYQDYAVQGDYGVEPVYSGIVSVDAPRRLGVDPGPGGVIPVGGGTPIARESKTIPGSVEIIKERETRMFKDVSKDLGIGVVDIQGSNRMQTATQESRLGQQRSTKQIIGTVQIPVVVPTEKAATPTPEIVKFGGGFDFSEHNPVEEPGDPSKIITGGGSGILGGFPLFGGRGRVSRRRPYRIQKIKTVQADYEGVRRFLLGK